MKKITKRDLLLIVLGLLTMVLFELLFNWSETLKGFKDGYKDATRIENSKN